MFCIYLRTNSDLCHLQHKLIGFYNRDEKCLQRGTDWVFKYSGPRFVFKGLNWLHGVGDNNITYKETKIVSSLLNQGQCNVKLTERNKKKREEERKQVRENSHRHKYEERNDTE